MQHGCGDKHQFGSVRAVANCSSVISAVERAGNDERTGDALVLEVCRHQLDTNERRFIERRALCGELIDNHSGLAMLAGVVSPHAGAV